MSTPLDDTALDQLFREARTHKAWQDEPVPDEALFQLYDLLKMGPTSANCSPGRFVFIRTTEGKERLRPTLAAGNVDKTMAAPVTVIVAHDLEFYERLPELFPHTDARAWFAGKPEAIQANAFRNGALQGGYLLLAARSLGLDCGPMSGFNNEALDNEFFPEGRWRSNFLVNLGHGDGSQLPPRDMRLPFDEACQLL